MHVHMLSGCVTCMSQVQVRVWGTEPQPDSHARIMHAIAQQPEQHVLCHLLMLNQTMHHVVYIEQDMLCLAPV